MGKIRFWLALFAAASVPLTYFAIERRQDKSQIKRLRKVARKSVRDAADTTRARLSDASEAARERISSVTDATHDTVGTLAGTASRVASGVVAVAPLVSALAQRNGDSNVRDERESDDWKKYPQMIGR